MKKLSLFILVLLVTFLAACSKDKWEGKIYKEQGVMVVENKGLGLWEEKSDEKIEFVEDLSLGVEEGDENLMFHSYVSVAVDSQLYIYILDRRNHRLLKFDREGNFIWKSGRKGQGPGEFQYPSNIEFTPSGDIAVRDGSSIHFFDKNGTYRKTVKLKGRFSGFLILPDNRLLMNIVVRGQPGVAAEYHSMEGKYLKKFPDEYRYGPKWSSGGGISYGGEYRLFDNKIYLSLPGGYEIREYDLEGKLLRKITRDFKIKPPNIKFKDESIIAYPSDVSGPCFFLQNKIIINLLNIVEEKADDKFKSKKFLDFFNEKGQFLGSYQMQEGKTLSTIDVEGNFYFIQWDPFPQVIRLKFDIH